MFEVRVMRKKERKAQSGERKAESGEYTAQGKGCLILKWVALAVGARHLFRN